MVKDNFLEEELSPVSDILGTEGLRLCTANATEIEYDGVLIVKIGLMKGKD